MLVVVLGANGGTGRVLVEQALAGGHDVRAVTRHPDQFPLRHDQLTVLHGDVTEQDAVDGAVEGVDAVVSALGVPYSRGPVSLYSTSARNVVTAMERHGVARFIAVSSSAVDPDAGTQGEFVFDHLVAPLIHRLGRTLYADMRRMEAIVARSSLDWTIVRPPALTDLDNSSPYRTATTFVRGTYATRADVAAFMLDELAGPQYLRRTVYIVSPGVRPSLLTTIWRDGIAK